MHRVVQVVPQNRRPVEAVCAIASCLARTLGGRGVALEWVSAEDLDTRSPRGFADSLDQWPGANVLLHYANYAYQSRGCPRWLVEGLEAWRSGHAGRLVTLFHEVSASGPPWTSAFWLAPTQRRLARRLIRASDATTTSLALYREILCRLGGDPHVLPVFSPCGEPPVVPDYAERPRRLVVFGGVGARARIYASLLPVLEATAEAVQAEHVVDLGSPIPVPGRVGGVPIVQAGPLSGDRIAVELLAARVGVVAHEPAFLHKSATYAAYCAHGVAPVALGPVTRPSTQAPPHWSPWTSPAAPPQLLAQLAKEARAAYLSHDIKAHGDLYVRLLGLDAGEP